MAKKDIIGAIRADLLDQLQRNGTFGKQFEDLVDDYVALWKIKEKLISDINKRGVIVKYTSNTGQENFKKNESVGELVKVNDRMTKLLASLRIEPVQLGGGMDDEM